MDPKEIVNGDGQGQWLNNEDFKDWPGSGAKPGEKGFVHVIVYADGTKVTEYYRYGTDGAFKTESTTDPNQQKIWKDAQQNTQRQTDQAERQVASKTTETNPKTGKQSVHTTYRDGSESWDDTAAAATAGQNKPGTVTTKEPDPDNPGQFRDITRELDDQGNPGRILSAEPHKPTAAETAAATKYKETKQDPTTGKWFGLKQDGTWEEMQGGPSAPTPNLQPTTLENGARGTFNPKTGQYEESPVGKPSSAPLPEMDPQTHFGNIYSATSKAIDQIYADPTLSWAEKKERADLIAAKGKGLYDETVGVTTAQNNIRSQDITQRQNTLAETQSRRSFSENLNTNAMKNTMDMAQYMPAGTSPDVGFNAYVAQLLMGTGVAGALGGLKQSPEIQRGPAQEATMQQGLPTAGGQTFVFNVGGQQGGASQGVNDAVNQAAPPAPPVQQPDPVMPDPNQPDPQAVRPEFMAGVMG